MPAKKVKVGVGIPRGVKIPSKRPGRGKECESCPCTTCECGRPGMKRNALIKGIKRR